MITLGLDPSLTGFGWCIHNSSETGPKRVVARGKLVTKSKDIFVTRYMAMREGILQILRAHPEVEAVGVESPPFGELWSEGLYGLFLYVNEALFLQKKDVVYFDPGSVKMLTKVDPKARKGKMFKSDMVAAAREDTESPKARWDHNEADAYHIARHSARFWELYHGVLHEGDLTPAEKLAFTKIHKFVRGKRAGTTVKMGALFKEGKRFFLFSKV